ncbi:MAG: radical SAM protein [Anaerolineae bacterium]|nr:radical SAM protein [Anaerolineae bacterium]
MTGPINTYRHYLPPFLQPLPWQAHPLDGKLLFFERDSGLNVLLESDKVAHLQRVAPRTLLIGVTNDCTRACSFCYQDRAAPSLWDYPSLLEFCRGADAWGVLEVAFGGGEPMLFPRWDEFISELYASTGLSVNFTTNGTLLTDDFLHSIAGCYGQIRLSIYEDNNWEVAVDKLARCEARFGVNWLITPAWMTGIDATFGRLLDLGVRDFLLIGYKGNDTSLLLEAGDLQQLERIVVQKYEQMGASVTLKLDACWGDSLPGVPRLFTTDDCGAGDDFLSVTCDKRVKPCSFFHESVQACTIDAVKAYWEQHRLARTAARIGGCGRVKQRMTLGE